MSTHGLVASLCVSAQKEDRDFENDVVAPSAAVRDPLKTALLLECGNPLENVLEHHAMVRKPSHAAVGCCVNG
jgi:hypothetical protein